MVLENPDKVNSMMDESTESSSLAAEQWNDLLFQIKITPVLSNASIQTITMDPLPEFDKERQVATDTTKPIQPTEESAKIAGSREQAVLIDMASSPDEGERRAGATVRKLINSDNKADRQEGHLLLPMLMKDTQHELAVAMLTGIESPADMHQMLQITADATMKKASTAIADMLRDEKTRSSALDLLRCLGSSVDIDRANGKRLLKLLNSEGSVDRQNAQKVLQLVPDIDERKAILDSLENPKSKKGAEKLLQMLERPDRHGREAAERILTLLGATRDSSRNTGDRLILSLGSNVASITAVETIMRRLEDPEQIEAVLDTFDANPQAGKMLIAWLNDENTDKVAAARGYIELKAASETRNTATTELVKMIADPAQANRVGAILSLRDPGLIGKFMELRSNPRHDKAVEQLVAMLSSGKDSNQRAVENLLVMLGAKKDIGPELNFEIIGSAERIARPAIARSAEMLLKMLSDTGQANSAREILAKIDDNFQRHNLVRIMETDRTVGDRVLAMMGGKDKPTAQFILERMDDPARIKRFLDIISAQDKQVAAERLKAIVEAQGDPEFFIRLLGSEDKRDKELGQRLLKDLNESRQSPCHAEMVLAAAKPTPPGDSASSLTNDECSQLMNLLADGKTLHVARLLVSALQEPAERQGVRSLLSMLRSDRADVSTAAERLLEQFNNPKASDRGRAIFSHVNDTAGLKRLSDMFGDDRQRTAAEQIVSLTGVKEGRGTNPGSSILRLLGSALPVDRDGANKLLEMLTSKDTGRQRLAKAILQSLSGPQELSLFMRLSDSNPTTSKNESERRAGIKLEQMMGSEDQSLRRAAANVVSMLAAADVSPTARTKILSMLGDDRHGQEAAAVVAQLKTGQQLAELMRVASNPKQELASRILIDMLRSGRPEQTRSVIALLEALRGSDIADGGVIAGRRAPESEIVLLLERLAYPRTMESAKRALTLADNKESLLLAARLLQTAKGDQTLRRLQELRKDPQQAGNVDALLTFIRIPEEAIQLTSLIGRPACKDAVDSLVDLIKDEDPSARSAASQLLRTLAETELQRVQAGRKVLEMLGDPAQRALAQRVMLTIDPGEWPQLLEILGDKSTQVAAKALCNMLLSEDPLQQVAVPNLLLLLATGRAAQRSGEPLLPNQRRAEQLFSMLNTRHHSSSAIQKLIEMNGTRIPVIGPASGAKDVSKLQKEAEEFGFTAQQWQEMKKTPDGSLIDWPKMKLEGKKQGLTAYQYWIYSLAGPNN